MRGSPDILDVFSRKGSLIYRVNTVRMRPVPGYPGYFATISGHIFTTGLGGSGLGYAHPYPLVPRRRKKDKGYLSVNLTVRCGGKAKVKNVPAHRLVCLAFHGMPPKGRNQARHLNGIPHDNRACNLAWGSNRENYEDSVRHGTALGLRKGQRHPASKLGDKDVPFVRGYHARGHSLRAIASHFGVTKECIRAVVSGETWRHVPGVQEPDEPLSLNTVRSRRGLLNAAA
jgi:hypothetical protein